MLKPLLDPPARCLLLFVFGGGCLCRPAAAQDVPLLPLPIGCDTLPTVPITGVFDQRRSNLAAAISTREILVSAEESQAFFTIQPLLSRIAGVQVTPNSGAPGDWATVRMRGSGLHGADQPLYVIDGLPALNADFAPSPATLPAYTWGVGAQVSAAAPNPLLFVAPQEFERITVLKGGLATARYGSQGANGVLLITTKRGGLKGGRQAPRLSYETLAGVQQVRQRPALLDARQYAELANDVWRRAGSQGSPPFDNKALGNLGRGTDWQRELFGAALVQSHVLSLAGSTLRTRYLAIANYLGQNGVVLYSQLRRYGLRLNFDYAPTAALRLWLNVAGAAINRVLPPAEAVPTALLAPPTVPAYTTGELTVTNLGGGLLPGYAAPFFNPLLQAQAAYTTDATRRLLAQVGAAWQFAPSLRFEAVVSNEQAATEATSRALAPATSGLAPPQAYEQVRTRQHLGTTNAQASLFYQPAADGPHALSAEATLLVQHQRRSQEQTPLLPSGATGSTNHAEYPLTLLSVLATGTYTFDQRLKLLALLRAEYNHLGLLGTGGDQQPQLYPGLEASWDLGKESFLRGSRLLSSLRLLASVGQSSNNAFVPTYLAGGSTAQPGWVSAVPARTTQLTADLDIGLLDNNLSVQPGVYSHYTAHANVLQALPVAGAPGPTAQEVDVRNQGVELAVASSVQAPGSKLTFTTRLAAAHNWQTIVAVADAAAMPGLVVGENLHPYYGWQRTGLSSTGAPQYHDANGDGAITAADGSYFGTGIPSWLLHLTQQTKFGRWSLHTQAEAMLGYQLLNPVLAQLDYPAATANGSQRLLDRWTPTRPSTTVPAADFYNRPALYDNLTPESASHLRLSQLILSYYVRPEGARALQVWAGVQNLFVLTSYRGFDPNVSSGGSQGQLAGYDASQYPVPRTWLLGVRASL